MKKMPPKAQPVLRKKAERLLSTALSAIVEPLAQAGGFKDSKAFKAQLVKSLDRHIDFAKAAHDFHDAHQKALTKAKLLASKAQVRSVITPSGRVQATRHDPSRMQKDRTRGYRAKGGQRVGKGGKK